MSKSLPKRFAKRLARRDGTKCHYCDRQLKSKWLGDTDADPFGRDAVCIDHLLPRSRGGKNNLDNLVMSCRTCNSKKGTKTDKEFRRYLAFLDSIPDIEKEYADDWRVLMLVSYFKSGRPEFKEEECD